MKKLREQVREGIDSVNMFRSVHENNRDALHCYCLAIAFYLDHYENGVGKSQENKEKQTDIGTSQIFGHLF